MTKVIYDKATFFCEWDGVTVPFDAYVEWYRNGAPVLQIPSLEPRIELLTEGILTINEVDVGDTGWYECRIRNGREEGSYESETAYLNVECKGI